MTRPPASSFPPALVRFVELFDAGAFWESHEALEAAWRESRSPFYKGLILHASAMVHARRGNAHGVLAQLRKARSHLAPYAPSYLGVAVDAVLRNGEEWRALAEPKTKTKTKTKTESAGRGWAARGPGLHIVLDPRLVRGDEPELRGEGG